MAGVPVKTMGQVLMYKPEAGLTAQDIERLREAGFIPICVQNYSDIKVLDYAGGSLPATDLFVEAMKAMTITTNMSSAHNSFLQGILAIAKRKLMVDKPPAPPAE